MTRSNSGTMTMFSWFSWNLVRLFSLLWLIIKRSHTLVTRFLARGPKIEIIWFFEKILILGAHYSKSQIIAQKFNFDKTPTFSRVLHPNFFFRQFFSWNQSCQQLKSPKPQHFHEFFAQKNRQFYREVKVEFLDKKWRFRTVYTTVVS